jgi:hypothetical protein
VVALTFVTAMAVPATFGALSIVARIVARTAAAGKRRAHSGGRGGFLNDKRGAGTRDLRTKAR